MRSLPLFHRIAGKPVIVLGEGEAADARRRLVERAGGVVIRDLEEGLGRAAHLAFVAHEDPAGCEADAFILNNAGVLVNVTDRPDLCDFTVPSVLDRDPVLVAVGTDGASAGLAKHLRLRLEQLLPSDLGQLADSLNGARAKLRGLFPDAAQRRRALDAALQEGGPVDPLTDGARERLEAWVAGGAAPSPIAPVTLIIVSDDPDNLTLRQARLLGTADYLIVEPGIAPAILDRARADAVRLDWPADPPLDGQVLILRRGR